MTKIKVEKDLYILAYICFCIYSNRRTLDCNICIQKTKANEENPEGCIYPPTMGELIKKMKSEVSAQGIADIIKSMQPVFYEDRTVADKNIKLLKLFLSEYGLSLMLLQINSYGGGEYFIKATLKIKLLK
jgi:hypothetical protein